jgi:hypothetical protein
METPDFESLRSLDPTEKNAYTIWDAMASVARIRTV